MPSFILTKHFNENKILQGVKKTPGEVYLFNFHWVELFKWAEVNRELSCLWYGIFCVGGMQLPLFWAVLASTRTLAQEVLDFLRPSETIYLQIILVTSRTT